MSKTTRTIVDSFFVNLLAYALGWAIVVLGIPALWPSMIQLSLVIVVMAVSLLGFLRPKVLKPGIPSLPYYFADFLAWAVAATVWTLMTVSTNGTIPASMVYWSSGIMIAVSTIIPITVIAKFPEGSCG